MLKVARQDGAWALLVCGTDPSGRLNKIEDQFDPAESHVDDGEAHRLGEIDGHPTSPARTQHEPRNTIGSGTINQRACQREPDTSSPGSGDDDHEGLSAIVDAGEAHDASLVEGPDPEAGLARAHPRDE